jgi:hypothetical protein
MALGCMALGCGGDAPAADAPVATLGATTAAERAFRPLMRRWALGTPEERRALDKPLRAFSTRFADDPLVRLALTLRAFNALDAGDLDGAMALVSGNGGPPAESPLLGDLGVTRDLATLVAGAVERRKGQPHAALSRLRPLLHKMLDDFATLMLDEELVSAALGAHAWLDAVEFMDAWRSEAPPGTERQVAQRVSELLGDVPKPWLLDALEARRKKGAVDADNDMARDIAQRLAIMAVTDRDIALATQLVRDYKALLGGYGEAVARLASDTTRGRIAGGTVGALLSLRTRAMQRRSVEVTAGMWFGLRKAHEERKLHPKEKDEEAAEARFVSRHAGDAPEDIHRALSELAGEGAALIVAGVDPEHSEEVARFADANRMPVMLMTPDASGLVATSPFVYFIGEDPADTVLVLSNALKQQGAKVVAGLGAPLAAEHGGLGVGVERECDDLPSVGDLRGEGADALVVLDGAYCDAGVVDVAKALGPLGVGLGVPALMPPPARSLALSAGVFPIDPARPDARLDPWIAEGRDPPSWWAALGRDAAVLAYAAVAVLKPTAAGDDEGVRDRRHTALLELARAESELWTTASMGFTKTQVMERTVTVTQGGRPFTPGG